MLETSISTSTSPLDFQVVARFTLTDKTEAKKLGLPAGDVLAETHLQGFLLQGGCQVTTNRVSASQVCRSFPAYLHLYAVMGHESAPAVGTMMPIRDKDTVQQMAVVADFGTNLSSGALASIHLSLF